MPSKDRLADLHAKKGIKKSDKEEREVRISLLPRKREEAIDKFLSKVDQVTEKLDLLDAKLDVLKKVHANVLNSPVSVADEKNDLTRLMKEITTTAMDARVILKGIQADVESVESKRKDPLDYRIKKNQHQALNRRLWDIMSEYNKEQVDYRQRCKTRVKRELLIADPSSQRTDEQIDELLENGSAMIFSQGVVAETQKAKEALADIEARHQDILALERNIVEVKQLFDELSVIVESQAEIVDRIETNVERAMLTTEDAKKQTAGALSKQKSARRLKIILLVVLVIILIVTAISLASCFS